MSKRKTAPAIVDDLLAEIEIPPLDQVGWKREVAPACDRLTSPGLADEDEFVNVTGLTGPADFQEEPVVPGEHKTVLVRVGGNEEQIDAEIAPLIAEIWRAGIETVMSCQDSPAGFVWIEFPSDMDARLFLDAVTEYEDGPDTLYNRIAHVWHVGPETEAFFWIYDTFPEDTSLDYGSDGVVSHTGAPDFCFSYSVRFPRTDLPTVLARME